MNAIACEEPPAVQRHRVTIPAMIRPQPASERLLESPEQLVASLSLGRDAAAEARLVKRYAHGVRLVLNRHTRDTAVAEDLFQETFRVAVAQLRDGKLREGARLPAFLASVARNLAIAYYRKSARRQTEADSPALEEILSPKPGPLNELVRSEEAKLVRQVLDGLTTPRDREILYRFYIAEEEREHIAADHGITSQQLNRLLYRARQRYKELYVERLKTLGQTRDHITFVLLLAMFAGSRSRWTRVGRQRRGA